MTNISPAGTTVQKNVCSDGKEIVGLLRHCGINE
jgi:hypothetical protein